MKSWNILFQFPRRRRSLIQMSIYKWFRRWRAAPAGQEQFQFQSAGQHHWHQDEHQHYQPYHIYHQPHHHDALRQQQGRVRFESEHINQCNGWSA